MRKLISVIAPMFNEEELVRPYCDVTLDVLRGITEYDHEIILVDDGSEDDTYHNMMAVQTEYPDEIGIVHETRNFGLEGAIRAGIEVAAGDVVVVMDADLQDPPSLIVPMLEKIEAGADIVTASRTQRNNDGAFKRTTANLYYRILDSLSDRVKLEESAANYRMMTRRAVDAWLSLPEKNNIFRVTIPYIGMKTAHVEYGRDMRYAGETKYHFKSMIRYALESITGISTEPLTKLLYLLPLTAIFAVVALVAFFVVDSTLKPMCFMVFVMTVLTEMVLAALACIGVYVGEILTEAKARPQSMVERYLPSGVSERR